MKRTKIQRALAVMLGLVICTAMLFTGCGEDGEDIQQDSDNPVLATLSAPIKIAALKGPTGMGLTYLMEKGDDYQVTLYQSPDEAVAKLLSGEADIAAVSSNLGAVLYNKNQGDIGVIAVNTGGISYLVENGGKTIQSLQDLKGKTIVASGKGGTPEYMLNRLLTNAGLNPQTDLNIQWLGNHSDAAAAFLAEPGAIAMLPEPFVSVVSEKGKNIAVSIDLNELWDQTYDEDLPMGIFIAKKSFMKEREKDLAIFMKACDLSAEKVNSNPGQAAEIIAANGIVESAAVAQKAIPRCNIMFEDGKDAKEMLSTLYTILMEMEPSAIGGALPADDFYYMPRDIED